MGRCGRGEWGGGRGEWGGGCGGIGRGEWGSGVGNGAVGVGNGAVGVGAVGVGNGAVGVGNIERETQGSQSESMDIHLFREFAAVQAVRGPPPVVDGRGSSVADRRWSAVKYGFWVVGRPAGGAPNVMRWTISWAAAGPRLTVPMNELRTHPLDSVASTCPSPLFIVPVFPSSLSLSLSLSLSISLSLSLSLSLGQRPLPLFSHSPPADAPPPKKMCDFRSHLCITK